MTTGATMVDRLKMERQLILEEGLRLRPYTDTEGNATLGVGYNVTARTMEPFERIVGRRVTLSTEADCVNDTEALLVCREDIDRVEKAVLQYFPGYAQLDEVRQRVCVDLAFNVGFEALHFKLALAAVKKRDWSAAAKELYRSKWAQQVGKRADRLATMMLTGRDYQE